MPRYEVQYLNTKDEWADFFACDRIDVCLLLYEGLKNRDNEARIWDNTIHKELTWLYATN